MQVSNSGSVSTTNTNRSSSDTAKTSGSTAEASSSTGEARAPSGPAAQLQLSHAAKSEAPLPRYLQPVKGYPNPHAKFGNTYDYLKVSDQKILREAYDYAVENGTSLESVNEAAWYLGLQRHQEAKEAAGTQFSYHVSDESIPFILAKPEDRAEELEKIASHLEPTFLNRLKRVEAGDFFGTDNPVLMKEIFSDAVDHSLGPYRSDTAPADRPLVLPNASTDPESLLLNHLSGADKSELSRAYQNARDNDLDPEEVRKAALLLAVQRMNENMTKTLDENSSAAQAVKASSELFRNEIDTPNKLIELAEKVLGEDAADSFRQMVGQPSTEEIFGRNSTLRQALFLAPAYNLLNMSLNG